MLTTAASSPPVPAHVRMNTSCLVLNTRFRPAVHSSMATLNSGPRWLIIGLAPASNTDCGTGVGPGIIRSCFSSKDGSSLRTNANRGAGW